VLPGIAAVVLAPHLARPDQAYPTMMQLLPSGLLGLVFAALIAAIIASTASKINSIATIFTLDLYAKHKGIKTAAEEGSSGGAERRLVAVGRIAATVAILVAIVAARPLLGRAEQAFQFIQEFSGFFTPGITVIFLLGLFWKRASEAGAIAAAVASVLLSTFFWFDWAHFGVPALAPLNAIPFLDRMMIVFFLSLILAIAVSLARPAGAEANRITTEDVSYATSGSFNLAGVGIVLILIALYATWW
jgi:SSS family solute:Na+ symporter